MEFPSTVKFEDVVVEFETHPGYLSEGALLCIIPGREEKEWIPKNQIDDSSEVFKMGDSGTLIISEWIALQKELV